MKKTITKEYKHFTITITYNNQPSKEALKQYATKLKKIIDSKVIAS